MISLIWFISVFFSEPAAADVRRVGNGGGFAEMITLVGDRLLPKRLDLCLAAGDPCNLGDQGLALGKILSQKLPALQRISFTFGAVCSDRILTTADKVEIPSCLLYEVTGEHPAPLCTSALALVAVRARLEQAGLPNFDPAVMKPLAEGLNRQVLSAAIDTAGGLLLLHSLRLKAWWEKTSHYLVIETPLESRDISAELARELGCESTAENVTVNFEGSAEIEKDVGLFDGTVRWECIQRKYKARLRVRAGLNSDHGLEPSTLTVVVYQKESVW